MVVIAFARRTATENLEVRGSVMNTLQAPGMAVETLFWRSCGQAKKKASRDPAAQRELGRGARSGISCGTGAGKQF